MITIRTTQIDNRDPDVIDLGIGQPGFDLLPLRIMRRAAAVRMAEGDATFLNYGYEQGDGRFRVALARYLNEQTGVEVDAGQIMATAGASQALDMICTYFTEPGDTVFVERPSYFLALRIFADHKLNVVEIATDENGLVLEALEEALAQHKPTFLYTIPTFQNPSGVTLPAERRQRLVELSAEHDFLIVADEAYHLLDYSACPPPPMSSFDDGARHSGRVLSVGSFSKILAPGLRLGWVQAHPSLLETLTSSGLLDSGGGLAPFTSNLVRVVLDRGWQEEHRHFLRQTYQRRATALAEALHTHLGDRVTFHMPQGGFFIWVALPQGMDAAQLLPHAHQQKTSFHPGAKFGSHPSLSRYLRLSFAFYNEEKLEEGVRRLARVVGIQ